MEENWDIYQHEIIFSLQADMFKPLRCSPLTHLDLRSAHLEFIHKGKKTIHDPSKNLQRAQVHPQRWYGRSLIIDQRLNLFFLRRVCAPAEAAAS